MTHAEYLDYHLSIYMYVSEGTRKTAISRDDSYGHMARAIWLGSYG